MRRLRRGERLLVATHNADKLSEIRALLAPYEVGVVSSSDLGLPAPEETEDSFVGNARLKAHAGARATGLLTLADDSGMTIDALGGAPGVHTSDWAETPNGRNFDMAMRRCWTRLEEISAPYPRRAQFRAALVMADPGGGDAVFEGMVPGQLVWPKRGVGGHGYDPIFQPDGHDVTFGEMDLQTKNRISHRAVALEKFIKECVG